MAAAKGGDEVKAVEPTTVAAMITKETVPESFIERIRTHPSRKLPPPSQDEIDLYNDVWPERADELVAAELANMTRWNYLVDLEQDCLRQYEEQGYAEVGIDFSKGVKQLFILSQPPQPQVMTTMQQENGGDGGRSKTTTLVGFSGFAIIFVSLVVLLSCLLLSRVNAQV